MLVLSRQVGEKLNIGDNIVITINRISGNRVTVGIEAPGHIKVLRTEIKGVPDPKGKSLGTTRGYNSTQANPPPPPQPDSAKN